MAATLAVVALFLQSCTAAQPCCQSQGSCGLTLGEPVGYDMVRARPERSRAPYYFGLGTVGAGLASVAIGSGYALAGGRHRDEASLGGKNQNLLLDKADANDERATVGLGLGVPLLIVGSVLLFLQPDEEPLPKPVPLPQMGLLGDASVPSEVGPPFGAGPVPAPVPVPPAAQANKP